MQFEPKSDVVVSVGVLLSPEQNVPQLEQDHICTGLRFISAKQKKTQQDLCTIRGFLATNGNSNNHLQAHGV